MIHDKVEELLGVYALHATEPNERRDIAAHLAECSRCRAEVSSHDEMVAMLASPAPEAPVGLWAKISQSISQETPPSRVPSPPLSSPPFSTPPPGSPPLSSPATAAPMAHARAATQRRSAVRWGAVVAVAAALVAFAGVRVAQLGSQVKVLDREVSEVGIAGAAAKAAGEPHQMISLTAAQPSAVVSIIATRSGAAYWLWSSLRSLPTRETYQLWGLSRGKPVSLALIGSNPHSVGYFRLENAVTKLMVTAEPKGGTTLPTTPVLAEGNVPRATFA
jgi:hypothetical protein